MRRCRPFRPLPAFYGNARDVGRIHERRLDMLFRVLFQNFQDGIDLRPFDADKKRHAFLFKNPPVDESIVV